MRCRGTAELFISAPPTNLMLRSVRILKLLLPLRIIRRTAMREARRHHHHHHLLHGPSVPP